MAWTLPTSIATGNIVPEAFLDALRDNLLYLKTNIALEAAVELTIAAGVVTKTYSHHTIDTQADAATDDLDTINGGAEGEALFIRPSDGARTIVVKHGTGNIWNPSLEDVVLNDADDCCLLIYDGANWCVIVGGLSETAVLALIAVHAALDTGVHGAGASTLATESDIAIHAALETGVHGAGGNDLMNTGDMIDEDDMVSDSNTKVPTQQSVKAYVDDEISDLKDYTDALVEVAIGDYCFVNTYLPTDYCLQWDDSSGEVAIRKETNPDSNPAVTLFNGFRDVAGVLYVWL